MPGRFSLVAVALLLCAFSVCFGQTVVYQQPSGFVPPNGTIGFAYKDTVVPAVPSGTQIFDSFTPATSAVVISARWFGFTVDTVKLGNNPVGPNTDNWQIGFFADAGGTPGAPILSATLPASSVIATKLGTASNVVPVANIYQFDAALPAPFVMTAGVKYWFSAVSLQSASNPVFYWITGSGGDSLSLFVPVPAGVGTPVSVDFAFALLAASPSAFQLKYFNTNYGSGHVIVSNAGTMSTGGNPADDSSGTICANFYSFDPNEEMQTCCACPVTPNGLSSLNVNEDIVAQNLIVNPSSAITVKVLFSTKAGQNGGGICDPTQPSGANLANGGLAWGTNLRNVTFQGSPPTTVNAVTETRFTPAELSFAELTKLTTYCRYIKILGSSVGGICKSCRAGARGSIGQ